MESRLVKVLSPSCDTANATNSWPSMCARQSPAQRLSVSLCSTARSACMQRKDRHCGRPQVSVAVENVLQETLNLLVATEDEDERPSRQALQSSREQLDKLLLSHRKANCVCEELKIDLNQAQATVRRIEAQGGYPGAGSTSVTAPMTAGTPGVTLAAEQLMAVEAYEAEMRACLFSP